MSPSIHRLRFWHGADRLAAIAASLCAVHCAALPFVIAILPFLGLEFLAGHTFERVFVACAALLAAIVLVRGWWRHRRRLPLWLALPGLLLLVAGICVDLDSAVTLHTVMVVSGGLLVACAHLTNLHFSRRRATHGHRPGAILGHHHHAPGRPLPE